MIFRARRSRGSDVSGPSACAQRRIRQTAKILFEAENLCFGLNIQQIRRRLLSDICQQELKNTESMF